MKKEEKNNLIESLTMVAIILGIVAYVLAFGLLIVLINMGVHAEDFLFCDVKVKGNFEGYINKFNLTVDSLNGEIDLHIPCNILKEND